MISFTVKGKNFPPGAAYWVLHYYYTVEDMGEWKTPLTQPAPISKTVEFTNIQESVGFAVFFASATAPEGVADITGPYAYAATSPQLLKDNGRYILDFHGEVGLPTLIEEALTVPVTIIGMIALFLPHWPWIGPPVPSFLPPWPWYKG